MSNIYILLDMLNMSSIINDSHFKSMIYASAYSMSVRERELELNSVKKSNTSGCGKHCTDFRHTVS